MRRCYAMLCVTRALNFHVLNPFLLFSLFSNRFWAVLGRFWDLPSFIFRCFFGTLVLLCFLGSFFTNFGKFEKMQSAQNTAPVHRFKGSPVWKKCALLWKNASLFSSIFHQKSIENQARKLEKLFSRQISITHRFLAPLLAPRVVFFPIFGSRWQLPGN